jgi:CheY-like chemotaxis protein
MSSPFSFEHLADIRQGARRMVERSRAHEGDLNQLVDTVENAAATVRACVSARGQLVEADRLYSTIDSGPAHSDEVLASRPAAVLVVDDIEDVRELVALVLRDAGFVVRTAVNGLEGLLAAYEMRPDVIVMDLTMPVLNGLEATRLIKATHATRESRVIAYTGDGAIPPPLERWFVAILSKPSPLDIMLAAVQNAVSL